MNNKVKLAIVGFGRIVELVHLPLIKCVDRLTIVGVYDITPQRIALAEKRGLPVFRELDELMASNADAVLIATPPSSHCALAEQAMEHGKHALVEKPVSLRTHEAVRLRETSIRTGTSITVFHNRRFDADYAAVRSCIGSGELGRLLFVERKHHMFGSGASFGVKSFDPEWRNKVEFGGGALLDWGVHLVDQLLRLELGEIRGVRGTVRHLAWNQGEVEDYVHAQLSLASGIELSMNINFASRATSPLWVVGGDQATLVVASEQEAWLRRQGAEAEPYPMLPATRSAALPLYRNFAEHIADGAELLVTIDQAIETMRVLDQIRNSHQKENEDANTVFLAPSGI